MKLRWGIIGCGWVARDYVIPAIQSACNAELVAVCDYDARATAGYPALTLDELLASDADAVYIATPNNSHAELTARVARAGKHVFCEKPMATNLADAERMVEACAAAGVQYATAFDQRFHPAHIVLRDLIARGELGTVTSARIHYACWLGPKWSEDNWRTDPARAGGGAFIDLAPHGIDLLQFLLGDDMSELHCLKQRRVFDYAVDDGAVAMGRIKSGALCTLHVAYNCPDAFPRRTLEVWGTKVMVTARNTMGQTAGGVLEWINSVGVSEPVAFDAARSPFMNQMEAFSQSLLDRTPFRFSPARDLHTMKLLSLCL